MNIARWKLWTAAIVAVVLAMAVSVVMAWPSPSLADATEKCFGWRPEPGGPAVASGLGIEDSAALSCFADATDMPDGALSALRAAMAAGVDTESVEATWGDFKMLWSVDDGVLGWTIWQRAS